MVALTAGAAGGLVFFYLHLPLPWMLGSMFACGSCAVAGLSVTMPMAARLPMTAVIGSMLGSAFTIEVVGQLGAWPVPLAGVLLYVCVAGSLSYIYFNRIGRLDRPTAFFAGMPGGVVEMVTLGAERGGDERMISLVHGARIFLVVMSTPFLIEWLSGASIARGFAGWVPLSSITMSDTLWFAFSVGLGIAVGSALRLPAPYLLGPMIISACFHVSALTEFQLPSVVIAVAQIVLGSNLGCRFAGVPAAKIAQVFALSIGATLAMLTLSVVFALSIANLTDLEPAALVLALSPGGLPEMSLIALSLNVSVVFVVVHHLARVLLVVSGSGAVFAAVQKG